MSNNKSSSKTTTTTTTTTTATAKRKNDAVSGVDAASVVSKKSKTGKSRRLSKEAAAAAAAAKNSQPIDIAGDEFRMLDLKDIRDKLEVLCHKVPSIPEGNFVIGGGGCTDNGNGNTETDTTNGTNTDTTTKNATNTSSSSSSSCTEDANGDEPLIDEAATRDWAARLQIVLEEFNLYVCCVGTATYKWGTERTGAADQNLTLLLSEMASSQEQISTAVTPRITNLLAPVVDLVIEKTVTYKQAKRTGNDNADGDNDDETKPSTVEVKENHFTQKVVDPSFLSLCHRILARNAPLLRHVVLSNFHKLLRAMKDFLKAQENDQQHSRSFTY